MGSGVRHSSESTSDSVAVGSSPDRGSPSLSSLRGRYNGYYGVLRRIMRPPGVAPWLYRSLGTEHFDDIVLPPIAEESAGFPYYYYYYFLLKALLARPSKNT